MTTTLDSDFLDRADRYLRHEMLVAEQMDFEQEVLGKSSLLKDLQLFILVRKAVVGRQQKLQKMNLWRRRRECEQKALEVYI